MAKKDQDPAQQLIGTLPAERREDMATVRAAILRNLPKGYEETVRSGMLVYEIPLARYPGTYNKQPLMYAALSCGKASMSVHLMALYGEGEKAFRAAYAKTGKKLDMGKACVRFTRADDLALDVIGKAVASTPVEAFIRKYEESREGKKPANGSR